MDGIESILKKAHKFWREGKEAEAAKELEKAIKEYEKADNKYGLIEVLNEYGGALRVIGDYTKAIEALRRAEELCKECNISGENYASTVANMANVYREMKEFSKAENLFERAKEIFESLGIINYAYIGILNNYSLLLQENKLYTKAKIFQLKSVDFFKSDEKYKIPLAISYNNLYEICKNNAEFNEAKKYLSSAGEIIVNNLGREHPLYAGLLNNLADIKVREQDYDTALILYKEALNIIKDKYGKESSSYKVIENNINLINSGMNFGVHGYAKKTVMESSRILSEKISDYIKEKYSDLYSRLCLGLVGRGSECYLYEDEISKDHDCKARCMLFLNEDDYFTYNKILFDNLNMKFKNQVEIWKIGDFYKFYTSFERGPVSSFDFRKIEEYHLSTASNGEVFLDNLGEFTDIRNRLLEYYPKDLSLKFIALSLNKMAQAGQYNFPRLLERKDIVGAGFALNEFVENYIFFVHIINRKYMPFYKWSFKSCTELEILGEFSKDILPKLIAAGNDERLSLISEICERVVEYLNENNLSIIKTDFLTYQADEVFKLIKDKDIRDSNAWKR